jgi:hypothetical protein
VPEPGPRSQIEKFRDLACELEAAESEKRFEATARRFAEKVEKDRESE